MIKKRKIPKFEFTNERLTYFMKFTIEHVVYVIKQLVNTERLFTIQAFTCLLYTSPSPRDRTRSRMPSSA